MAILVCDRCGKKTAKLDTCNYCRKECCVSCVKSSKRVGKGSKAYICKDCWTKMDRRKKFKSA
ncbi:hypothetical protein GF412_00815 [Candidatus Micrarchaeota archaeon]|nr:hypothetical protein [Candidatus Micrarchaeota archaeon]MBD3417515.1 hypothetical protein [Candidatus Micrarchaeota archaeon]